MALFALNYPLKAHDPGHSMVEALRVSQDKCLGLQLRPDTS